MSYRYEIIENKAWLLDIKNNKYSECDLPKLFHHDILDENKNLIESQFRASNSLVGIFSTSQTQRFGKNKRGNIIYLVKPINNLLPSFLISYGGKLKGKIAIKFKYTNWQNKLPSGEIIELIGNYTDENLNKILMYNYNIYPKNIKLSNLKNSEEDNINRKEYNASIFSIDPDNCEDIDDALSIDIVNDEVIIGVHIAQPIYWLSINDIYQKLKYQFSTLYMPDSRKDLWGEFVTKQSSLSENTKKAAYTILFYYQDYNLVKIEDFPSYITNNKVLSYDNADNYEDAKKIKEYTSKLIQTNDYHDLVSFWMLQTNQYIGNKCKNSEIKIPYRVNNENFFEDNDKFDELPLEIRNKFFSKKIDSAYYSFDEFRHETLSIEHYCHFTSPIRRLVDTWIHYYLTYQLDNSDYKLDCSLLNYFDSQSKKFHRQINLIESINKLFEKSDSVEKIAYIYKIISNNIIEIYIPELGFTKLRLYNIKFDYLIINQRSEEELTIEFGNTIFKFKVGDTINIKIDKLDDILPKNKLLITLVDQIIG